MAETSHKPPSRIRYEQNNPTISFRVDRDTYDLLQQRLKDLGVSFAGFVKESLGLIHADIDEVKQAAWDEGYSQAMEEYQSWYFCNICGKRIDMKPNSDSHKAMIGYMKDHGWAHAGCRRQYSE
jgi:hypothetical protein